MARTPLDCSQLVRSAAGLGIPKICYWNLTGGPPHWGSGPEPVERVVTLDGLRQGRTAELQSMHYLIFYFLTRVYILISLL